MARASDLRDLATAVPDALVICDLAYAEFADEDLTPVALSLPNAVVVRTFSKAWGLAGLRVGYAMGSAETVSRLRAVGPPFPGVVALAARGGDPAPDRSRGDGAVRGRDAGDAERAHRMAP